jgi:hypothetical protein
MSKNQPIDEDLDQSPVWDLLASDSVSHPIVPSQWFVSRMAALARSRDQGTGSVLLRWLIPIPLAVLVALVFLPLHVFGNRGTYVSSESDFESNMEILVSSSD